MSQVGDVNIASMVQLGEVASASLERGLLRSINFGRSLGS